MVSIRKRRSAAGMSNSTAKEGAEEQPKLAAKQAEEEAAKQAEEEAAKQAAAEVAKQAAAEVAKQAAAVAMVSMRKRRSAAGMRNSTAKEGAVEQPKLAAKQAGEEAAVEAAKEAAKQAEEEAAKQAAAEVAKQAAKETTNANDDSVDDELENKLKQEVSDITHAVKEMERQAINVAIELNSVRGSLRRLKVDAESKKIARAKRMEELKRLAQKVLSKIKNHKHAWLFTEPVDVKGLGLKDYHEVIKKPMDLGTIQHRMDAMVGAGYTDMAEVCDDVRLVFSNAMTYNLEGSDVHIMAKIVSGKFEEQWKAFVEPKLQEEELRWNLELSEADALRVELKTAERDATEKMVAHLSHKFHNLDIQLEDLKQKVTPSCRTMSMEEKDELRNSLGCLPAGNLDRVIQILAQSKSSGFNATTDEVVLCFNGSRDEVEVDFYALDSDTLWRLHRHVQFVRNFRARVMPKPESSPDDAAITTPLSGKKRRRSKVVTRRTQTVPVSRTA